LPAITCITGPNALEETNTAIHFQLFPNPTTTNIQINLTNQALENQVYQLTILDIQGKVVLKKLDIQADTQIDVSTLTRGMYFVSLTNQVGQVGMAKILVQ
jgi:hypothetical protein